MGKAADQQKNDTAKFENEAVQPSDLAGDLGLSDAAAEQVTGGASSAGEVIDGIGRPSPPGPGSRKGS
jgi:hypothetical protein